jgi:hypothetical protein
MSTGQNSQNLDRNQEYRRQDEQDEQGSSAQNNNGNIGREVEEEKEGTDANLGSEKPVNEEGIAENQEIHWVGNHGQRSSNRPGSQELDSFSDQNLTDGVQQNRARNHVTNAGGTSQEDL